MTTTAVEYVLGTDEQESARLGLQNRLWSALAHEAWERAGIRPGMTIADVGCGPGEATFELAQIAGPTGLVYAVDESAVFLKHVNQRASGDRARRVERVLGDVQHLDRLMPAAAGTVDLAYARWVLCFVPRPEDVIAGVARLLKPGGRFVVQDYFNYEAMALAPRRPAFEHVIHAIGRSWKARGGDPDIVARLPGMLRRAGFTVEHLNAHQRVARPHDTMWAWPDAFWASFLPRLVSAGFITAADRSDFEQGWAEASADPDSFILLPTVFDVMAAKNHPAG